MDCKLVKLPDGRAYCSECDPKKESVLSSVHVHRNCPRKKQQLRRQISHQPERGPGVELKALLYRFGIQATEECKCHKRAIIMDERGEEWCEENIDTIVGWLKEEATKRHLPFSKTLGKLLIKRAIRNSRQRKKRAQKQATTEKEEPSTTMLWAYGVTTVPSRINDLLPQTLASLQDAGFPKPRLFVDGEADPTAYKRFGLEVTTRHPAIRIFGQWVLTLWELYLRQPLADRYAIFQDDFITYKNLRQYLEKCPYPERGYWNLYTFPKNQKLAPKGTTGWYLSNQLGKGAVALVLNREAVTTVLGHQHMLKRPQQANKRSYKAVDGAIVTAFKKADWKEYVHNPSLVQHTGEQSTLSNKKHALAISFRGNEFNALELL